MMQRSAFDRCSNWCGSTYLRAEAARQIILINRADDRLTTDYSVGATNSTITASYYIERQCISTWGMKKTYTVPTVWKELSKR